MDAQTLIDRVVAQYLGSGDYNGLSVHHLRVAAGVDLAAIVSLLRQAVEESTLSINFGDTHPNPSIRAVPDLSIDEQLARLERLRSDNFVVYPTASLLQQRVNPIEYAGKPFSLRLALGAPQLDFACFELSILDYYRRDPRYRFWTNDVQATLSIGDDAYQSAEFPDKHKVLIQSFGFAYRGDFRRSVAVFLRDLDGLTPEHQQIWTAAEVSGEYKLHPDYHRAAIYGDWELRASLSEAFIEEIRVINAMCLAIGWKRLFRQEFDQAPQGLAFLIRPTVAEFNAFVLLADKLLSDNINVAFFPPKIPREVEEIRADGKTILRSRGSIALLDEWLAKCFRTSDSQPLVEAITTLKKIRKLRQEPAHSIREDEHDESLFESQRQLFVDAYFVLKTLRLAIQNHPRAKPALASMDKRVKEGEIWVY